MVTMTTPASSTETKWRMRRRMSPKPISTTAAILSMPAISGRPPFSTASRIGGM